MEIPIFFIFVGIISFFIAGSILGYFGASAYLDKLKPSLWDCLKSSLLGGLIFGGLFHDFAWIIDTRIVNCLYFRYSGGIFIRFT